jgi:hypothetical protein
MLSTYKSGLTRLTGIALALVIASGLRAQSTSPCREPAPLQVTHGTDLFVLEDEAPSTAYGEIRAALAITRLPPETQPVRVTSSAVCEAWLPNITAAMRAVDGPTADPDQFLFEMAEMGPYMVVVAAVDPQKNPSGAAVEHYRSMYVFETTTRRYLGMVLV